jgi:hypothetical protein
MSDDVWGLLPKAQDDPTTIDEAIAAAVVAHNADAAAHLVSGGSLNEHKSDSVIDHPAGSVVQDKIPEKTVAPNQQLLNKDYFAFNFDSLDAWTVTKTGSGADAILDAGQCIIRVGAAIGNITSLLVERDYNNLTYAQNPFVSCVVLHTAPTEFDFAFTLGMGDAFYTGLDYGAAFFWDKSANAMKCRIWNGAAPVDHVITYANPDWQHILAIEITGNGTNVNFYVDNILVYNATVALAASDSNEVSILQARNQTTSGDTDVIVSNFVFYQDIA